MSKQTIYIINARTKEHRLYVDGYPPENEWFVMQSDEDGFLEHIGSKCPLPMGTMCEVKTSDDFTTTGLAEQFDWAYMFDCYYQLRIIKYRPIFEEPKYIPEAGSRCECLGQFVKEWVECEVIHRHEDEVWIMLSRDADKEESVVVDVNQVEFRPIPTHKEKTIQTMETIWADSEGLTDSEKFERLYDELFHDKGETK